MKTLHGVWAASITPLTPELAPDADRMVRYLEWLFENGCHGAVVFGTTGEANSFTVAERQGFLDSLRTRGIDMSRIIVGTGCTAVPDSVDLSRHAVDAGCAAILMLPPFYYKTVSDDGLFAAIASTIDRMERKKARILLYHFPRLAGIGYSIPVIQRLKKAYGSQIAGIKDSSGDTENLTLFHREIEDFAVFTGSEALLPYALEEGGIGCITATVNVTSRLVRAVYDGEKASAERMIRTRKALEALHFVPTMKHLLAEHHSDPGFCTVRPPLTELTPAHEQRLGQIMGSIGTLPNFEAR